VQGSKGCWDKDLTW